MASGGFDALAAGYVPELAGSVDAASEAVVPCEVELAAGELSSVAFEGVDALA